MMLVRQFSGIVLAVLSGLLLVVPLESEAQDLPPVQRGGNLADCANKLERQGGGWCEIHRSNEDPTIASVWPANLDQKTRMVLGPASVLMAWNGAAYDADDGILYFTGGGHTDYGGNEVYEFNLISGRWTRLTEPSPLDHLYIVRNRTEAAPARYCWVPDLRRVPSSTHSYDGIQFSSVTRTIFLIVWGIANGSCFDDTDDRFGASENLLKDGSLERGIYEFNPSRIEARNGLEPLGWRRLKRPQGVKIAVPRSVEFPDGRLLLGNGSALYAFDPKEGRFGQQVWLDADYGDGVAAYHPAGYVLSLHRNVLLVSDLQSKRAQQVPIASFHGMSLAVDRSGRIFVWDGGDRILTLDLDAENKAWHLFNWAGVMPQQWGRVYSKWQYVASQDVFVGLSTHASGVWVYKHPASVRGKVLATMNPQQLIDRAPPGSTVKIPPGLYGQGLFVNKSLTLDLEGVKLWGVAHSKGIINVNCDGCSVVIDDFEADGKAARCLTGNCAGVKAEGIGFNLTLRRAKIDNTVMGVLTDNRGGHLVLEDSVITNIGLNDASGELAHGVYAGMIDELVVRRSTIRNVNGDGHLLKSRAKETVVEDVRLLGEEGYHSRSIDLPCGGRFSMRNSVLQHGKNTDNSDVIAIGTEPGNCRAMLPAEVSIMDSWLIIDRHRTADERARTYGPNSLFRLRNTLKSMKVEGNHIVNLDRWSTAEVKRGEAVVPDLSQKNEMCRNRADCGLGEGKVPELSK